MIRHISNEMVSNELYYAWLDENPIFWHASAHIFRIIVIALWLLSPKRLCKTEKDKRITYELLFEITSVES